MNQSRQYYFEPNKETIKDWQKYENSFLNGIDTRVMFICESPGGLAKEAIPANFPTDGSRLYRAWATKDSNLLDKESILRNNKKFKDFRDFAGLGNCFITNICKCGKIPEDREPKVHTDFEIRRCSVFLEKELQIIKPSIIVAVGRNVHYYLKQLVFTRQYEIFKMTHYSYRYGDVWNFWKSLGEDGQLDQLKLLTKNLNLNFVNEDRAALHKKVAGMEKLTSVLKLNKQVGAVNYYRKHKRERCDFERDVPSGKGFYKFFSGEIVTAEKTIKSIQDYLHGISSKPNFRLGAGTSLASKIILESNLKDSRDAFTEYLPLHPLRSKLAKGEPNAKDRFLRMLSVWNQAGALSIKNYSIILKPKLLRRLEKEGSPFK